MAAPIPYLAQQPITDFSFRFSNLKYSATLAATTDTSLTVPGNAPRYKAVIKVKTPGVVWVALNGTAAVPVGASFASTTSELIYNTDGLCREVIAADVLHFYTASSSIDVSVVFYAIGSLN